MYFVSHSSSDTSSFSPRSSVIGACVCPLISPGRISFPCACILRVAEYFVSISARWPIAEMVSPFTAIAPSSMILLPPSIVTIVPPVTIKSARSFVCAAAGKAAAQMSASASIALRFKAKPSLCNGFIALSGICPRHTSFCAGILVGLVSRTSTGPLAPRDSHSLDVGREIELCKSLARRKRALFVSQRNNRIHARRLACGQPARKQRHRGQQQRGHCKHQRVAGLHAKQERFNQPPDSICCRQTENDPPQRHSPGFRH